MKRLARFPLFVPFHQASASKRGGRRGMRAVAALIDQLEDRTLLAAPVVVAPLSDVNIRRQSVERVATGLNGPLYATAPPNDFGRLFVLEKNTGQVKVLDLSTNTLRATPFLDLPDNNLSTVSEQGLLGLAFDPGYAANGLFYVSFTDAAGTSNIVRYQVSANDPNVANAASAQVIFQLSQPFANHNGGWLGFGPDGYLYVSSGDGGSGNDPDNRAQNLNDLHGKMLRLDIRSDAFPGDAARNYAIPPGNPYAAGGGAPEIWAYGLRNPWRPSFDRATGDLYIGDVGQDAREEINFQTAGAAGGANYGWRLREGSIATPGVGGARPAGNVDPVYDYAHGSGQFQGSSVTGGYVYRGPIADLQGMYLFGDFVSSGLWGIRVDRGSGTMVANSLTDLAGRLQPNTGTINSISSFGEDASGNLYIVDFGGEIFRVVPTLTSTYDIDLTKNFIDPDHTALSFSVVGNSNGTAVNATVFGGKLRLTFPRASQVPVSITVRATDGNGESTDVAFNVNFFSLTSIVAVGTGPGSAEPLRLLDGTTGAFAGSIFPFGAQWAGGLKVAAGDVNGDGVPDIVVTPASGAAPHVKIFDGVTFAEIASFYAFDSSLRGDVEVAVGEITGDGRSEVIVSISGNTGPRVRVFDGGTLQTIRDFNAFDPGFFGSVRLATGDISGDSRADIVVAVGGGAGPHVKVFDGTTNGTGLLRSFYAFDAGFMGGIDVAAGDIDGNGRSDIIVGAASGAGPHVRVFSGSDNSLLRNFFAFDPGFRGGIRVAAGDLNRDNAAEILVTPVANAGPHVKVFDGPTNNVLQSYYALAPTFAAGLYLAAAPGPTSGSTTAPQFTLAASDQSLPATTTARRRDLPGLDSVFGEEPWLLV